MTEPGRTRWTDDRIDDLAGEVRQLRMEMRTEFAEVRGELREMRRWTINLWATTVVGFVAVLIQNSLR
ncbi:MAG: hypothetical protein E6G15_11130 [Actinobacteria bacterium]|nr:MAG: hypothetical protein E6G15_11130 [Actinomycetota bacterium]